MADPVWATSISGGMPIILRNTRILAAPPANAKIVASWLRQLPITINTLPTKLGRASEEEVIHEPAAIFFRRKRNPRWHSVLGAGSSRGYGRQSPAGRPRPSPDGQPPSSCPDRLCVGGGQRACGGERAARPRHSVFRLTDQSLAEQELRAR